MTWRQRIKCGSYSNMFTWLQKPKKLAFFKNLFKTFRCTVVYNKRDQQSPSLYLPPSATGFSCFSHQESSFINALNSCQLLTCFNQWNSSKHTENSLEELYAGALLPVFKFHSYCNSIRPTTWRDAQSPSWGYREPANPNQPTRWPQKHTWT